MPFSTGLVHNVARKTRPELESGSPIRLSVSITVHNEHVENQVSSRIRNLSFCFSISIVQITLLHIQNETIFSFLFVLIMFEVFACN